MFITEKYTLAQNKYFKNIILRNEIHKLKCHKDQYSDSPKSLQEQPEILTLTETWLAEDDILMNFGQEVHQPFESRHQENTNRCSGGVAFVINCGLECRPIQFDCKIQGYQNELKVY